jgi:hypothetical protein
MSAVPNDDEPEVLFGYLVHPVASWFPILADDELKSLAGDIAENGLIEPPVVSGRWLLDGRNRLRACEIAGVEPEFRVWEGDEADIPAWIISKNVRRRHLGTGQRAMIAARLANREQGRPETGKFAGIPTQGEAAKLLGVSERSVRDARLVLDNGSDELIAQVDSGELAVSAAAKDLRPGWFPPPESTPPPAAAKPPAKPTMENASPAKDSKTSPPPLPDDWPARSENWRSAPAMAAALRGLFERRRQPNHPPGQLVLTAEVARAYLDEQFDPLTDAQFREVLEDGEEQGFWLLGGELELLPPDPPAASQQPEPPSPAEHASTAPNTDSDTDQDDEFEVRRCRVCGCTDDDCSQCVEATGDSCWWVQDPEGKGDLCSRCADELERAGLCDSKHPKLAMNCPKAAGHDGPCGAVSFGKVITWELPTERTDLDPGLAGELARLEEGDHSNEVVLVVAGPGHPRIDLRCCSVEGLLASLPNGAAHLVIADPPWDYVQHHGASRADNHYKCLRIPAIAEHIRSAARVGSRLALWCTFPLLGEWMAAETRWGRPVTGGAWVKSREGDEGAADTWELPEGNGHFGQGFHWSGCAEIVLVYTRDGSYTDRSVPVRNAWIAGPQKHSEKPDEWMAQWIRKWVPPGGLVVDLYAGRGSVARAVLVAGEGRRYVGAEIDPGRHAEAIASIAQLDELAAAGAS